MPLTDIYATLRSLTDACIQQRQPLKSGSLTICCDAGASLIKSSSSASCAYASGSHAKASSDIRNEAHASSFVHKRVPDIYMKACTSQDQVTSRSTSCGTDAKLVLAFGDFQNLPCWTDGYILKVTFGGKYSHCLHFA